METEVRTALIAEATKKSGLIWVHPPGAAQARGVWHVWREEGAAGPAAYVVHGGAEQALPGMTDGPVTVISRSKETGARLITWTAEASRVHPGDPDWEPTVTALAAARLNAPDHATMTERWARESEVVRLVPTGEVTEAPGAESRESHAAPPVPTPATTAERKPFMFGARNRAADR